MNGFISYYVYVYILYIYYIIVYRYLCAYATYTHVIYHIPTLYIYIYNGTVVVVGFYLRKILYIYIFNVYNNIVRERGVPACIYILLTYIPTFYINIFHVGKHTRTHTRAWQYIIHNIIIYVFIVIIILYIL